MLDDIILICYDKNHFLVFLRIHLNHLRRYRLDWMKNYP